MASNLLEKANNLIAIRTGKLPPSAVCRVASPSHRFVEFEFAIEDRRHPKSGLKDQRTRARNESIILYLNTSIITLYNSMLLLLLVGLHETHTVYMPLLSLRKVDYDLHNALFFGGISAQVSVKLNPAISTIGITSTRISLKQLLPSINTAETTAFVLSASRANPLWLAIHVDHHQNMENTTLSQFSFRSI